MTSVRSSLTRELRSVGLTRSAIEAVWPEWWSDDAETSLSATTELRYTVARRLGIVPSSLFDGPPRFIWHDDAKFKNLDTATVQEQAILTSFGTIIGRTLIAACQPSSVAASSPIVLREALLNSSPHVGPREVVGLCWTMGIPVIKTKLFPLRAKKMQAMSVGLNDRYAIILGRDIRYPAWSSFVLAHELGHILHGHITSGSALLDMGDPVTAPSRDEEETAADRFAFALLTGNEHFKVEATVANYSSAQLAESVVRQAPGLRVDPGVIALALAYATKRWPQTHNALKLIRDQHLDQDIGVGINWLASQNLDWDALTNEQAAYLRSVMGHTADG